MSDQSSGSGRLFSTGGWIAGALIGVLVGRAFLAPVIGELFSAVRNNGSSSASLPEPMRFYLAELNAELARLGALDLFNRRIAGVSSAEARATGQALSRSGFARLADDVLTERLVLNTRILRGMPTARCAAWARGTTTRTDQDAFLESLLAQDTLVVTRYARITARATAAELRNFPPARRPSTAEKEAAWTEVFLQLSDETGEQLFSALDNLGAVDDSTACWVQLTLLDGASRLPPSHAGIIALSIDQSQ